jgi:tRNA-2-methylthio-N6-dimethylallyladenosine synthase
MRDIPQVCEYLHIPAQRGSDAVLKRMRRQYSATQYVELIDRARAYVPGIAIASDFIVGFCGETEADNEETLKLIERCRFKNIFVFKYSPRPGTVAHKREADDVAEAVKRRRNMELLSLQEGIASSITQRLIGSTVEVLVEGFSKAALKAQEAEQTRGEEVGWRRSDQLVGRTRTDQIVVFPGPPESIGSFAAIRVTAATALTLHGTLVKTRSAKEEARTVLSIARSLPVLGGA